jgi:4-hydroxy-4-methyl-2-oxoglutarate aldolase
MTQQLDPTLLEALKSFDTPTVCNAIEKFEVRAATQGFFSMDTRCLLPELGTMVGYAITATVDASTTDVIPNVAPWEAWLRAMEAAPRPGVLVFKDVGPQPRRSAHFGEQMATISRRFGVAGILTDGGLRDVEALKRLGFHCFGPGLVPSHGNPRIVEVNVPVEVDGVYIQPGDLLHGDANGLTTIPIQLADLILPMCEKVLKTDTDLIQYFAGPEFSIEGLLHIYRSRLDE